MRALHGWIVVILAVWLVLPGAGQAQERIALRAGGLDRQAVLLATPATAPIAG